MRREVPTGGMKAGFGAFVKGDRRGMMLKEARGYADGVKEVRIILDMSQWVQQEDAYADL